MPPPPIEDYHVGIICALHSEMAAVEAMLDEGHESIVPQDKHDHNAYALGRIHAHNVVVACLPAGIDGLTAAATVAKDMSRTFAQLRFGLLVGIGGGIPNIEHGIDIRLGDIVVSEPTGINGGVVQYDKGKSKEGGVWERKGMLNAPPTILLTAVQKLKARHLRHNSQVSDLIENMLQQYPNMIENGYARPDQPHETMKRGIQTLTNASDTPDAAVEDVGIPRPRRPKSHPKIHYGVIASSNQVVKNAAVRDQLRRDCGALCVEMEAAGLMNEFPCLVIRGICDFADVHKDDRWHKYAAAAAAAYAKELLTHVSVEQTNQEKPVQKILECFDEHLQQLHEHHNRQETKYEDEKQRDCHRAIKTSNYEAFKNINPMSAPGTCRWLLDHPKYRKWRANPDSDLIWISADPGCGKSVLSRALIDQDLRQEGDDTDFTICYYFFRDNDVQDSLAAALCAILHQLFDRQPQLIRHAIPAWRKDGSKITSEVDELWRTLLAVMVDRQAKPMVCVLDALDECRGNDRRRLISMLCQFYNDAFKAPSTSGKLKFLVTSRPYEDIEYHFGRIATSLPSIRLRGEDKNDQIRKEIDSVVRQCVRDITQEYRLMPLTAERLERKLLAMEHRTYLWLHLAIDSIRQTFSYSLRPDQEAVDLLPSSVDEAYEQILSKIDQKQVGQVRTILQIIVSARRPLTIAEMTLALGVATSKTTPQSFSDLDIREDQLVLRIRQWCGLFVFINHSQLYLIHQTAKEFLLRDPHQTWMAEGKWKHCLSKSDIEREMARIYILYLCLEEFGVQELTQKDSDQKSSFDGISKYDDLQSHIVKQVDHKQELFNLAAESWIEHWRNVETVADTILENKALILYSMQTPRFLRWTRVMWRSQRPYEFNPSMNDLTMAAFNGHIGIINHMFSNNSPDLDAIDQEGHTALMRAAERGFHDVVALLIDKGASVNAQGGRYGNALRAASSGGYDHVVDILIRGGADVEAQGGKALHSASLHGHEKVASILVNAGADVNTAAGLFDKYGTTLQAASAGGFDQIVQTLLSAGANVNTQTGFHGNALYAASANGHSHVVQTLLKAGAHVNAQGGLHGNALQAASGDGHEQVVRQLLLAGADVKIQGVKALYTACMYGHQGIVRMLVDAGVNVNARGGLLDVYANALHAASAGGYDQVIQTLINAGADVKTQGDRALHLAATFGHVKAVQALIKAGAAVNAQGGPLGSVIQAASRGGHEEIIPVLLEAGVDIKSQGSKALYTAAIEGHEKVAQMLIDAGVDIDAQGGPHGTALQAALVSGHKEVVRVFLKAGADLTYKGDRALSRASAEGQAARVKILIEAGADVNAQGESSDSALHLALANNHEQVARMLIEAGADIQIQGELIDKYNDVLINSAAGGHNLAIRRLLEAGVNVNTLGKQHYTALHAASFSGHEDVVQTLLAAGANVDVQGGLYGTALHAASYNGHEQITELLLTAGAAVNAQVGPYGNALQAASYSGHTEIVQMLLAAGAEVNARGGLYGNALQAASYSGHEQTVSRLIEAGADVNAQGGAHGCAIKAASYRHQLQVMRILLEAGANDGDKQNSSPERQYALLEASANGNAEKVQTAITANIDVNARGGRYHSALQAASIYGHLNTVQMLLKAGANDSISGGPYGCALIAASCKGHVQIVLALLMAGSNVNCSGICGDSLYTASFGGYELVVRMLVKAGADFKFRGGPYGTALHAASVQGHIKIVRLLIEAGADINAQAGPYDTALCAATLNGHEQIVQILEGKDADHKTGAKPLWEDILRPAHAIPDETQLDENVVTVVQDLNEKVKQQAMQQTVS